MSTTASPNSPDPRRAQEKLAELRMLLAADRPGLPPPTEAYVAHLAATVDAIARIDDPAAPEFVLLDVLAWARRSIVTTVEVGWMETGQVWQADDGAPC